MAGRIGFAVASRRSQPPFPMKPWLASESEVLKKQSEQRATPCIRRRSPSKASLVSNSLLFMKLVNLALNGRHQSRSADGIAGGRRRHLPNKESGDPCNGRGLPCYISHCSGTSTIIYSVNANAIIGSYDSGHRNSRHLARVQKLW